MTAPGLLVPVDHSDGGYTHEARCRRCGAWSALVRVGDGFECREGCPLEEGG